MKDSVKEMLEKAISTTTNITSINSPNVNMNGTSGTGSWYGNSGGYSAGYYSSPDLTNHYCTLTDFIRDIVRNKFKEDFKFTNDCIIEIIQEIIDNPSTRTFIKEHMPILILKSNDIGIFILNAVINQIEEDNK